MRNQSISNAEYTEAIKKQSLDYKYMSLAIGALGVLCLIASMIKECVLMRRLNKKIVSINWIYQEWTKE